MNDNFVMRAFILTIFFYVLVLYIVGNKPLKSNIVVVNGWVRYMFRGEKLSKSSELNGITFILFRFSNFLSGI